MRKKQNNVNNKNVLKQRTVDFNNGDVLGKYDIVIQRDISLKRVNAVCSLQEKETTY